MNETAPDRVITEPATIPDTQPERRLAPDKLCPDQQGRIVRKIIEVIP